MNVIDLPGFLKSMGFDPDLRGDELWFCCPFHSEHNPSFSINLEWPHKYNCFGCQSRGNIYTFVRDLMGKSFKDVFGDVAQTLHSMYWNSPKPPPKKQEQIVQEKKDNTFVFKSGDVHSIYSNPEALDYIRGRGIKDSFIQFSNMQATKLAWINQSKMFNRVLIDCFFEGKLVNVEARDYTGQAERKVLYPYGLKKDYFFYNQDNISLEKDVVIVEGIMDLAKVWPIYDNVVSAFGAGFAKESGKVAILKNWGKRIILMPDNDAAGIMSMEGLYNILDCEFYVASLPENIKDAGDASEKEIETALDNRMKVTDWLYSQKNAGKKTLTWE